MRAGKPNQISRARRPNDPLRVLGITWRPVSLYKAVVFSTTVVICFLLLFARVIPSRLELEVGRVTPREVRATRTVTFEDTEETERLRTIERQATPPIVKPIRGARQEALQDLDGIFDAVRTVRANASLTTLTARLQEARQQIVVSLSDNTLRALLRATDEVLTDLQDRTRRILDLHLTKDEIRNDLADRILESRNAIAEEVGTSNISRVYQPVVTELAQQALRPNQEIDQQATQRAQETAASRVDPATRTVEEGTPFIRRGDVVAKWQYDAAVQLGLITPSLDYLQILSLFVALLAVLVTLGLYIRTRLAEVYADARRLAVVGGALIVFLLAVRLAAEYGLMVAAAPAAAAFGALVLVILFDLELAFVAAIAMALLGGIAVVGNDPRAIILSALGAFVAALIGTLTTRRAQMVVRAAIAVAAANCAILLITNDVFGFTSEPRQVFYAFIGGLVAGVLAVATLPPLE